MGKDAFSLDTNGVCTQTEHVVDHKGNPKTKHNKKICILQIMFFHNNANY